MGMLWALSFLAAVAPAPVTPPPEGEVVLMFLAKPELGVRGFEIVTMNLDGINRRRITDDDKQEFLPHFSPPDGKRLVYTRFVEGTYGSPDAKTHIVTYDLAKGRETDLGEGSQAVWSPDGLRLAFLCQRFAPQSLCMMNADGSGVRETARPSGQPDDRNWGDLAWSSTDWILFAVAQDPGGCFKVRLDKIRPDGTARTRVTDGGPNCTPPGWEQSGDADPGFSGDGATIYSSRGYPWPAADTAPPRTERRLVRFSSEAWYAGKPERDLSLAAFPSCVEGVPKGSPDGRRVLLFRDCPAQGASGIVVTDENGSFRRFLGDGFGPDWHPLTDSHAVRESAASWAAYSTSRASLTPLAPQDAALDARALEATDGKTVTITSASVSGAPLAAFEVAWTLLEARSDLVSFSLQLSAALEGGTGTATLALLLYNFETGVFESVLSRVPADATLLAQAIEVGDLRYVEATTGTLRARVIGTSAAGGAPLRLIVDELSLRVDALRAGGPVRSAPLLPSRPPRRPFEVKRYRRAEAAAGWMPTSGERNAA